MGSAMRSTPGGTTAAPPESPYRPEHAVHADHVEDGRVLVHHDTENNYGGDDSEDDYAEDDFDDVFDGVLMYFTRPCCQYCCWQQGLVT